MDKNTLIQNPSIKKPHVVLLGAGASRAAFPKGFTFLLRSAWLEESSRNFEHIEIIDTAESNILHERWHSFTPTNHYHIKTCLSESSLLQWPRRSCESLYYPMTNGEVCEDFPLPIIDNLIELHNYILEIAKYET